MESIPVLDFQKYGIHITNPDSVPSSELQDLATEMLTALDGIGFFYLKNHGISDEKVQELQNIAKEFFSQPLEEKMKCTKPDGANYGYIGIEKEQLNEDRPFDFKEAYNVTIDCDVWPKYPLDYEKVQKTFLSDCQELACRVLDIMSIGLDLEDRHFLRNYFKTMGQPENMTTLRTLFYPPTSSNKAPKGKQIGCGEHSDYEALTLLFQDSVGGLEVKTRNGGYIPATPIPRTVVVKIGDLLERWTSGRFMATKHRVIMPSIQTGRQSIAAFIAPDSNIMIKCLDGSDKYPEIRCSDYILGNFYRTTTT